MPVSTECAAVLLSFRYPSYVSVSDRQFLTGFMIGLILMCVCDCWAQWLVKITEGSWQGSFTVNNDKGFGALKPPSEQCLERFFKARICL